MTKEYIVKSEEVVYEDSVEKAVLEAMRLQEVNAGSAVYEVVDPDGGTWFVNAQQLLDSLENRSNG